MNLNYLKCLLLYLYKRCKNLFLFLYIRYTKKGKKIINKRKKEALKLIKDSLFSKVYEYNFKKIPDHGVDKKTILTIIDKRKSCVNSKISGCVYTNNEDCNSLIEKVNNTYLFSNPLHPDIYPELVKMESEIIKMVGCLYDLPSNGGGNLTTGGTESTICALKAYKKMKVKSLYFSKPEVLCTKTVHAAVFKACELLDLNITFVDLNENYVMDVEDLKRKISYKTCVIVASAPCFPYGLMDPIDEISLCAETYNVPLHVDACLGGFITPFHENLHFSFKQNIQSISVDPHKFGYAPKGSSVLMWKDNNMKHHQYFICNNWTGGIYASVSLPGSRVGSQIATTWTSLLYNGYNSYKHYSKKIVEKTKHLSEEISKINTFEVIGIPNVNVVAFYSKVYSTSQIVSYVSSYGWNLNILQDPICLHLCITPKNINNVDDLIDLLINLLSKEVKVDCKNIASIYGMSASLPDKSVIDDIVTNYLDLTTNI